MTLESDLFTSYQSLVVLVADIYGRPAGEGYWNEERQGIRAGSRSKRRVERESERDGDDDSRQRD